MMGLGALVVAVVIAVAALLLTTRHDDSNNRAATPPNFTSVQPPASSAQPSTAESSSSERPSLTPTMTSPTPEPVLPTTQSPMDLVRVGHSAQLAQVAALLDTYFTGINNHDAVQATSVFAPDGTVNPDDPRQVAAFGRGIRTSTDDRIVVLSITPANYDGRRGLAVRIRFRSRQAAELGPNNETCTNWVLTEKLVRAAGGYRLLGSRSVRHTSC